MLFRKEITEKEYFNLQKLIFIKSKKIELALLSKNYTEEETNELNDKLSDYGIENTTLVIKHNL